MENTNQECIDWLEGIGFERASVGTIWTHKDTGIMCLLFGGKWIASIEEASEFPKDESYATAQEAINAAIEVVRDAANVLLDAALKAEKLMAVYKNHTAQEVAWLLDNNYRYDTYYNG